MSLIKELLKITPPGEDQSNVGNVDDLLLPKPAVKSPEPTLVEAKRKKAADLPEQIPYVDDELHGSDDLKSLAKRHPEAIQAMMNWN